MNTNNGFTNLEKVYFPKDKITKREVLEYYEKIAPILLPHLKNRPESLNRYPNGISRPNFFQKNFPDKMPAYVKIWRYKSESTKQNINYILCQNKKTLLYIANLGSIEINPWNSRISRINYPDWLVIDLDPGKNTFDELVAVARTIKKTLDVSVEKSYVKTSGKRGLHIFIPLGGKYPYSQVRDFAHVLATLIHQRIPNITSLKRSPNGRRNRIYLDYLQNSLGQTIAAPYSLRPVDGAVVSTPLRWSEVKPSLDPKKFNIKTIFPRLEKYGDLWENILQEKIDLKKAIDRLQKEMN